MAITHDKLYVECNIEMKCINGFKMVHAPNEHTSAIVSGIIEASPNVIHSRLSGETISIFGMEDIVNPQKIPIFTGIIVDVSMRKSSGGYTEVTIQAKSLTYTIDIHPRNRSFQELKHHIDIIKTAVEEQSVNIISNIVDRMATYPLIQYRETDWEFLKRIASNFNAPLIPDVVRGKTDMYIGMRRGGKFVGDLSNMAYSQSLNQKYYSELGYQKPKQVYNSYTVSVPDVWQVGDYVTLNNDNLYVYSRELALHREELVCTYTLGAEELFHCEPIYNEKLKGTSLVGTVLEAEKEQVKLHLHIDETQEKEIAFPYSWKPESGNVMYCMPQVGTLVNLYFPQADEQSAIAINSLYFDSQTNPQMQEPKDCFFTTEHRKEMRVLPQLFDWYTRTDGTRIGFGDDSGVRADSCKTINLQAVGDVTLSGKQVEVLAPKEISIAKKDIVQSTVLNFCNDVDTIGGTARFGTTAGVGAVRKVTPPKLRANMFQVKDIQGEILSAIPIDLRSSSTNTTTAASVLFGGMQALNLSHKRNWRALSINKGERQNPQEIFTWPEKKDLQSVAFRDLRGRPTAASPPPDHSTENTVSSLDSRRTRV